MSTAINIAGLDKAKLLKQLWENASPASYFAIHNKAPPTWKEPSKEELSHYIDYYCGRCIKADISNDVANPSSYDREFGSGQFEMIVKIMRGEVVKTETKEFKCSEKEADVSSTAKVTCVGCGAYEATGWTKKGKPMCESCLIMFADIL